MNYSTFLGLVKTRITTYEFLPKPVLEKDILKILEAARFTPSNHNTQPWHFVVVRDKIKIANLMQLGTLHVNYPIITEYPPVLIAFVMRPQIWDEVHEEMKLEKLEDVNDLYHSVAMSAMTAAYAATSLKIDSCILTPRYEEAKRLLEIQSPDEVLLIVGLGYSKKREKKGHVRRTLKSFISYEQIDDIVQKRPRRVDKFDLKKEIEKATQGM